MLKIQGKAIALTATLLLGGVMAPLSHFIYMAAADMAAHHAAMVSHQSPTVDGANLVETHSEFEPCSYAALFATQMAGDTPPTQSVVAPDIVAQEFSVLNHVRGSLSFATLTIRGPPSYPIAVS